MRQGYALTEKDDATGLDHTWFRKNENQAGRWTSPDPYNGSMSISDPQSFNRYSYVENEPTNFIDPSGLNMQECGFRTYVSTSCIDGVCTIDGIEVRFVCTTGGGDTGRRGPGDIPFIGPGGTYPRKTETTSSTDCKDIENNIYEILDELAGRIAVYLSIGDGDPGHREQIIGRRNQLARALRRFDQQKCVSFDPRMKEAREKAKYSPPTTFNRSPVSEPPIMIPIRPKIPVSLPVPVTAPTFITPMICIICNPAVLDILLRGSDGPPIDA